MYFLIVILLILCIVFFIGSFFRRKRIIRKICRMGECEKVRLLDEVMEPFGFVYLPEQDVVSSALDAWQRKYGYHRMFDETAVNFSMVFDCEPVYFYYDNCTWLIEFWKGQYGINTGAEIGIYKTDFAVSPTEFENTWFHSVSNSEMCPVSFKLYDKNGELFCVKRRHWWLTGFDVGRFTRPENLAMKISILFPNAEMRESFVEGLLELGYRECDLCICGRMVCFVFDEPYSGQPRRLFGCRKWWAQWKNRFFCRLFRIVTSPFQMTADRILYLFYLLPPAFRHMLYFRKHKSQRRGKQK